MELRQVAEGSGKGLGCSSNATTTLACSFTGSGNNVVVYNTSGTPIGPLSPFDDNANSSAPIVFADGGVVAADDSKIGYLPSGSQTWYYTVPKNLSTGTPLQGNPISPVPVGSNIVITATNCVNTPCGFSTFVLGSNTSFVTQVDYNSMNFGGVQYETYNTPTVDNTHSPARVYIVASAVCSNTCGLDTGRQGALIALDIQTASGGAVAIGKIINTSSDYPKIIAQFPGPSGASPVLVAGYSATVGSNVLSGNGIFFDSLPHGVTTYPTSQAACYSQSGYQSGSYFSGCFLGYIDSTAGTTSIGAASKVWSQIFNQDQFQAGAGLDPRGGLWVFPVNVLTNGSATCSNGAISGVFDNCLISLKLSDGTLIGSAISLTPIITGLDAANGDTNAIPADVYLPSSDAMVSTSGTIGNSNFKEYLTVAAIDKARINPRVVNFDVTAYDPASTATTFSPGANWVTPEGGDFGGAGSFGQFASLVYTDSNGSHNQIVLSGLSFGPYSYGY